MNNRASILVVIVTLRINAAVFGHTVATSMQLSMQPYLRQLWAYPSSLSREYRCCSGALEEIVDMDVAWDLPPMSPGLLPGTPICLRSLIWPGNLRSGSLRGIWSRFTRKPDPAALKFNLN